MEVRTLHANISWLTAELMSDNVDLLAEILRCLPSKSLMRFKSVCKSWRALIISRYFCSLWRQHHDQGPGILLTSEITHRQHGYVPLSGPTAGVLQFEIPRNVNDSITQSCDGFLLHRRCDRNAGIVKNWVYNPATMEVVMLPPLRMDACKIHAKCCSCLVGDPVLAFDSHSRRRVVALATHLSRCKHRYICQVCVMENRGRAWRSSSKPFGSSATSIGVHWRDFVVWINVNETLFYDVGGEALRVCDSPDGLSSDYFGIAPSYSYHLGESGGHLHFIHEQESNLIIYELKHDLSGWFVKHKIEISQMEASLFGSIGWGSNPTAAKFKINFLVEEKDEDSKLVLGCLNDVVLYRIQDHKSWKLCEWEFAGKGDRILPDFHFHKFMHQHVETISRFHDRYSSDREN